MANETRTREQVPQSDRWRLESLYAGEAAWEADLALALDAPAQVAAYEGRLGEGSAVLAEVLGVWFDAMRRMENVWVYAHLRSDEDLGNSSHQKMMERARSAYVQLSTAGAYLAPEILSIEDAAMAAWMDTPELATYRVWLEDVLRGKPHVLTPAEERLMSMAYEPLAAISRVYSVLKNVDLSARLPEVEDETGTAQKLTHGLFIKFLENRNRAVRKAAFDRYYAEFQGNRQTIAAALDGEVKSHIFTARVRRFGSALEASLFDDNVDVAVYDALIEAVHDALPAFYRYMALRKRLLGVDRMHMYDIYVPVVESIDLEYTYDQAVEHVLNGVRPLGQEYVDVTREGLLGGWVDRYENVGKRSGAYSSGSYDSQPFILMNFAGTLDSVFTLAHELGHSMHSWYSNHNQPYHLADYRILVAEVASTTNESLLNDHLLAVTEDPATRAYLIDRYLDSFRATLFRQTMFAEFEKIIHAQVEAGEPLTVESLDGTYYDLVKLYFGDAVAFDDEDAPIAWEWSRIDHFFYDFYVYKYATGMSSAIALAEGILQGHEGALKRYLTFLQSGSSRYPLDLLRTAGVDLTTPDPVRAALAEFERLVGELDTLLS